MPSNRAILADLEAAGLKPHVAHSNIGADGRLRKPDETPAEVAEVKVEPVKTEEPVSAEVHVELTADEHADAKKKHKREKKEKPVNQ